jgi:Pectate lyase superfamily protein
MAGPGLPTNVVAGGTGHVAHTNAIHNIVNKLDTGIGTATAGQVLKWNGTVYAPGDDATGSSPAWIVNVKDHGAVGNGTTDDSTAIIAARNAVFNSRVGGIPTKPTLFFPPGNYRITTPDALFPTGTTAPMKGYQIKGENRETCRILFQPVGASSTLTNMNLMTVMAAASTGAASDGLRIEKLTFESNNANASFAYLFSEQNRYIQDTQLIDVWFQGSWKRAFGLDGGVTANLNSEMLFESVATTSTSTPTTFADCFMRSGVTNPGATNQEQDQFLNYWFRNCKMEHSSGDTLVFDMGGFIVVDGGSWIHGGAAGGTHFRMGNYPHYWPTMNLTVRDVRFELRNANCKVIDCAWRQGAKITFDSCTDESHYFLYAENAMTQSGRATPYATHVYRTPANEGPIIRYQNCQLMNFHQVVSTATVPVGMKLIYDGCSFANMQTGGVAATSGATSQFLRHDGGAPRYRFQDCLKTTDANTTGWT